MLTVLDPDQDRNSVGPDLAKVISSRQLNS